MNRDKSDMSVHSVSQDLPIRYYALLSSLESSWLLVNVLLQFQDRRVPDLEVLSTRPICVLIVQNLARFTQVRLDMRQPVSLLRLDNRCEGR